jgi:hypothetical protein
MIKKLRGRPLSVERILDGNGYVLIRDKTHPFCRKNGYITEHTLVIEKFISKLLGFKYHLNKKPQPFIIHHINGIITDNRIENLLLFKNIKKHSKFHRLQEKIKCIDTHMCRNNTSLKYL